MEITGLSYVLSFQSLRSCACRTIERCASENRGQVTFNGSPVPGAAVTATQGPKTFVVTTIEDGSYAFPDLPSGTWKLKISMMDFATIEQVVMIAPCAPSI
jgi:hypothetical protein